MKKTIAAAGLALILASCSSAPPEPPAPPPPIGVAPPALAPPPVLPRDQCGAYLLQHLVGRPRSEIPVPVQPDRQRVACTTCPVTQDYSPSRLNFFFDAETGLIRQVRCG